MDIETLVIGAGVVGLAVARQLAMQGREVLVLDKESQFGTETSSRNSEVIHAGIYYPAGSLKARLCVEGKSALYRYCEENGVPARRIGKLVVATSEEQDAALRAIANRARENGVDDLQWLDKAEVKKVEPEIVCHAALRSPSSGIIDSHALMLALLGEAEAHGALLALRSKAVRISKASTGFTVSVHAADTGETATLRCANVINCAGHGAIDLAHATDDLPSDRIPTAYLAKGNYFTVTGSTPFRHLIYPIPVKDGLGIHVTLDLSGRMRLGPDVQWVDRIDYTLDPSLSDSFRRAVEPYWPGIAERELYPVYSGIRPKVYGPAERSADFIVDGPSEHGLLGLVNLFGIESPGLTSCLAIAALASKKLSESRI